MQDGRKWIFCVWKTVERIENERKGLMVTFQGGEGSVVVSPGCYAETHSLQHFHQLVVEGSAE